MSKTATYSLIASTTASGSANSVTFSSITGTFTDLVIVLNTGNGANSDVRIRLNSDTGSNYSRTALTGNGSTASSFRNSSQTYIEVDSNGFSSTSIQQNIILNILDYSNATTYKTVLSRANNASYGTDAIVGLWRSTSAITSIEVYNSNSSNWLANSTFKLYGIQAVN